MEPAELTPNRYTLQYIAQLALRHRKELIVANIVAILAVIASVPIPLLMPLLVDEVLLGHPGTIVEVVSSMFPASWHGPWLFIGAVLALTIVLRFVALILNVWQNREFVAISKDVIYRVRKQLLGRLQNVAMSEYETLGGGAVSSHLVTDLDTVDQFIGSTLSKFLVAVLTVIGTAIVLLWMHWQLALFILLMNPMVIYFTTLLGGKVKKLKRKENSAFEIFQQSLTETLDNIQQIRASNREQHYLDRVVGLAQDVRNHSVAYSWKSDAANRFSFVVFLFGFDVFRAVSMLMVLFSDLSVGQMMAVFGYLWFMMGPVQEVLNIQYAYYSAGAALARINRLLGLKSEPSYPHEHNPFVGQRSVEVCVDNVEFSYGPDHKVLDGVSLRIAEGEKVALVGASGGGKSTLAQVVLGLYPPNKGDVLFNNVSITQIGADVVRENVACVLQRPAMLNDSVRMNLTLGRDIPDQLLWKALDTAQLKQTVESMPLQLDSVLGLSGVRLSGGQRQRLAVARMILTDPKVVILDEATSALDADTEARLHAALNQTLVNRTTLIIAHRLSAVKQADRVLVFEDGKITEQGSHHQLIEANGLYAKLYGMQQSA